MASLKDIADEVGVSVSLVSKVINDKLGTTGARKELIEAIKAKAEELGYKRNFNSIALLAKRQGAIGVFMHRMGAKGASLTEDSLEGMAEAAHNLNLRMMLNFVTEHEDYIQRLEGLHTGMVDGVVLSGVFHMEAIPLLLKLKKEGLHLVSTFSDPIHESIPNTGLVEEDTCYLSTKHLIEQGCKKIATFDTMPLRTKGFRRAMSEAGLEVNEHLVFPMPQMHTGFKSSTARAALIGALEAGHQFDGICAQSDSQAIGVINELISRGIRVPEDVKVTGIDNSAFCEACSVPITSVDQKPTQRGYAAVEMLEQLIEGKQVESNCVKPELIIRQSSVVS
ncbi:LacI family DNA-binding transcriptional regulator [Cerasicoccus maritimus]|uniref:LacI family DNA-binding transcriptional regulator n=1 Tax=Cerasicoccus maritimus TaxID=490089 RepID=UPI00285273D3|nr:LacI family DNA-binding transcriptional regulator [Cerasicoccus maritimus]